MNKPTKGIDTIQGLVGLPPKVIAISKDMVSVGAKLKQIWNTKYIAFIPYCFKCVEPLDWYIPFDGETIFSCPKCGRRWVKDDKWLESEA